MKHPHYTQNPPSTRQKEKTLRPKPTFSKPLSQIDTDDDRDFDKASFGIVKVLGSGRTGTAYPGLPWEPKAAFHALADYGRTRAESTGDRPAAAV